MPPPATFIFSDGFRGFWCIIADPNLPRARPPVVRFNSAGIAYMNSDDFRMYNGYLGGAPIPIYQYSDGSLIRSRDASEVVSETSSTCDHRLGVFQVGVKSEFPINGGPAFLSGLVGDGCDLLRSSMQDSITPTAKKLGVRPAPAK